MTANIAITVCVLLYSMQAVVCDLTLSAIPPSPSIAQDVNAGTSVTKVSTTDGTGPYMYTIVSQTPASPKAFALNGSTGVLSTVANANFDHTTNPTYTVVVKAEDSQSGSGSVTITVTVTAASGQQNGGSNQQNGGQNQQNGGPNQQNGGQNQQNGGQNQQNAAPVFNPNSYTVCVVKGTTQGTAVTTITATDADGDAITYSLTGNTNGPFEVVGNKIKVLAGRNITATPTSYNLTYQASSGTPAKTAAATVTINVKDSCPGGGNSSGRVSGDILMCMWMFGTAVMALMSLL